MSLNASTSEYQFTPAQSNMLSAPVVGQYFAEQDMVYTTDNASTKAQFGLSSHDQQSYDAANYYMFNPTLELGVDCGRTNEAAGRPNLDLVSSAGGGACYPMSTSAQRASKQLDASFNSYAPSAEQVVLAEGDIRYAPSRFVDQNNYVSPSMSDLSYQPRLMGTRDAAQSGCSSTSIDQTIGNSTQCALQDDPLPYFRSSDPRTLYGVDEPHSEYWASLDQGGMVGTGCSQLSNDYTLDTSVCNVASVETGMPPRIPPQYAAQVPQAQMARGMVPQSHRSMQMAMAAERARGARMASPPAAHHHHGHAHNNAHARVSHAPAAPNGRSVGYGPRQMIRS